jgi:uncharacterized protein (DUF362 family)
LLTPLASACRQMQPDPAALPTLTLPPSPVAATRAGAVEITTPTSTVEPEATALQPTSTPTSPSPSPTPEPSAFSQVVLVWEDDRAAGVAKALSLLEQPPLLGQDVLLKPNFNSADPSPGSTHPEILRALLSHLAASGAGEITLADRSGMGDTRGVMAQIGVFDLIDGYNCRVIVLDELAAEEWVVYRQQDSHWQDGFPIPRLLANAEYIVQTCNLKTHRYGGHFTMSLKNSVGFVAKTMLPGGHNYMTELHNSPHQRLMIAEINAAYKPDLIVMDAVEALVNGGPDEGKRVRPGLILASRDRVALDAVGVAILRMYGTTREVSRGSIFEQEQIARAAELGLGATGPEQIEFVTDDAQSAEIADRVRDLLGA